MKTIKIINLILENFKGIRNLIINFDGRNAIISGQNGTGKTTIADSVSWLLFGKDIKNTTAIEVKTKVNGQAIHHLNHSVSAELDIDGQPLKLGRTYYEKWTKKRGSITDEFNGHTTDYYINDVPVSEKDFKAKITSIIDEKTFLILTNPTYFNDALAWKERRNILLDFIGRPSAEDIISANKNLAALPLDKYTIEEIKAMAIAQKKKINEEIKGNEKIIPELQDQLVEIGFDVPSVELKIAGINSKKDTLLIKKQNVANGFEVGQYRVELTELKGKLISEQLEYDSQFSTVIRKIDGEIQDIKQNIKNLVTEESGVKIEIATKTNILNANKELVKKLQGDFVNVRQTQYEGSDICPCCSQALPKDKITSAQDNFNEIRAKKLTEINAQGKACNEIISKLTVEIEKLNVSLEDIQTKIDGESAKLAPASAELEKAKNYPPYQNEQINAEIADINAKIEQINSNTSGAIAEINTEIQAVESELATEQAKIGMFDSQKGIRERITELEERQAELAKLYENAEKNVILTEEYTTMECNILTDKINSMFEITKFKMFETQINGGIGECCEAIGVNGVEWHGSMNDGQKVNVGLDIINTLSKFYEFQPFIFVDNTESVTKIGHIAGQYILLEQDKNQKELKVEVK